MTRNKDLIMRVQKWEILGTKLKKKLASIYQNPLSWGRGLQS